MTSLMPFKTIECGALPQIQRKLLEYIAANTDITDRSQPSWRFLNTTELLRAIPELMQFFSERKLYVQDSAAVILYNTMPLHVDAPPVVAKINFPVLNGMGWANQWYTVDSTLLAACPDTVDELGFVNKDITGIPATELNMIGEIDNLETPIVFNSAIPHMVLKNTPERLPRIVASFTFHNQPLDLLK
jgi:hypothetical protein